MAAEPQRRGAENGRDEPGQRQRQQQSDPGRAAVHRRVPGRGIGADADEGGLTERREAADAGEQNEPERGKRIDADIVHQRDGEAAEERGRDRDEGDGEAQQDVGPPAHHASPSRSSSSISSSMPLARCQGLPDQDRNERAEDDHFLERAAPERRVALQQPDEDRADGGRRIADQAADDGADEGFQADQKAGIVIERRHRPDQNAGNARERRGEEKGDRAGGGRKDADQPRADAIDGGRAQRLAGERALEEQEQQEAEQRGAGDDQDALAGDVDRPEVEECPRHRLGAKAFGPEDTSAPGRTSRNEPRPRRSAGPGPTRRPADGTRCGRAAARSAARSQASARCPPTSAARARRRARPARPAGRAAPRTAEGLRQSVRLAAAHQTVGFHQGRDARRA